jgi:cellulose synthase/poly-beta-1,6-N-acetylglucosamine synthase-like glycosyltransferase
MLLISGVLNSVWTVVYYNNWHVMPVLSRLIMDHLNNFFNGAFYFFLFLAVLASLVYLFMGLAVVLTKEEGIEEKEFDEKKAPFVTIQIPTRNEIIAIRCAKKCLQFDYPKDKYNILIGDDSNDESVSKRLVTFAKHHKNIQVIKREENIGYKPGNLNNMLKHTKGEIIVVFDSDFIPEKDFLRRIITPFIHDKKVAAVQGRWKFINANKNFVTALASGIVYTCHNVALSLLSRRGMGFLCGSAEAVRKKDLIELGGWKNGCLTEDIEYSLRLHKNGKKIVYLPKLECYNEAPSRPIDLYKQQMRWGHGVISAYKTHATGLITTSNLNPERKLLSMVSCWGYVLPILFIILFLTGSLSFMTHRPEAMDLGKFAFESLRNIAFTSGWLICSFVALYRAKKARLMLRMMLSSFSFGLVTVYYVNIGIIKAIANKPMNWYLLKKSQRV